MSESELVNALGEASVTAPARLPPLLTEWLRRNPTVGKVHGGARKGAGRPRRSPATKQIRVLTRTANAITARAQATGKTVAQIVAAMEKVTK